MRVPRTWIAAGVWRYPERILPRVVFLLLMSVLLAACSARARLVIVVEGEEGTPQLTELLVRSLDADGNERASRMIPLTSMGGRIEPVSFVVEPRDASRLARVSIEARDGGGATRIVRTVRVVVPEGSPRTLWVELQQCCQGRTSCGEGMTCRGGSCVSDEVRSDELLTLAQGEELRLDASIGLCATTDASVPPDGGSDGGTTDGGGGDGGSCAAGCDCEQSCDGAACACTGGCGCALSCTAGATCSMVGCSGAGTICDVDARGATAAAVTCADNASCDVDCTDAASCAVRCRTGAQCLVRCNGAGCDFMCTGGSVMSCSPGVSVCRRACP